MIFRPGESITVNSRKYDGSVRRSWQCEFVTEGEGAIHLVGVFEETVEHPDLGTIEKGTLSYERFYLNRWYNYFRFEQPAGTLRNYYINICMPPDLGDGVIDYVDLDIDLIVWPDGRVVTLDIDEFEANAKILNYRSEVIETSSATLMELQLLLADLDPASIALVSARI